MANETYKSDALISPMVVKRVRKGWSVVTYTGDRALPPYCDFTNKVISVPSELTEYGAGVRAHELGHLRATKHLKRSEVCDRFKITANSIGAIEDYCVNKFQLRNGVTAIRGLRFTPGMPEGFARVAAHAAETGDAHANAVTAGWILCARSFDCELDTPDVSGAMRSAVSEVCTMLDADLSWDSMLRACKRFDVLFPVPTEEEEEEEEAGIGTPGAGDASGEPTPGEGDASAATETEDEAPEAPEAPEAAPVPSPVPTDAEIMESPNYLQRVTQEAGPEIPAPYFPWRSDEYPFDELWAPMEIETGGFVLPSERDRLSKRFKAHQYGTRIKRPAALYTGGAAFARKKRHHGATFLLDVSGSMGHVPNLIDTCLRVVKAGTFALYGSDRDRARSTRSLLYSKGRLVVVAAKGQRISDDGISQARHRIGGLNGCDGFALDWLAEQQGPRFWICDGCVTGHFDEQTPDHRAYVRGVVKRGRIYHLDPDKFGSVESFGEYLAELCAGRVEITPRAGEYNLRPE
jgi:hypothetical protein